METSKIHFVMPTDRERVTKEPQLDGKWTAQFPDVIGFRNQGGGEVPADLKWRTSPKQWQEEMTPKDLLPGS